jgi:hypothetical protein
MARIRSKFYCAVFSGFLAYSLPMMCLILPSSSFLVYSRSLNYW